MDQILIRDLVVQTVIGVHEWERAKRQEVIINLTIFTDILQNAQNDDLSGGVDYGEIARQVKKHVENAQRFTLEALAADLAQLCLENRAIQKVCVRVEKPNAIPGARSAGVEIERCQGE